MGVNYTNITYDTDYPTPPAIQINDSDIDIVVDGLDANVSLVGPSEWTPTHYKLWNINGVTTSGEASWVAMASEVAAELIEQTGLQHVYGQFKDATHTSDVVTSSGVTFSWVSPTIHHTVDWADAWSTIGYGSASSATLENTTYNTDIVLSKSNIPNLRFSGKDLSDIVVGSDIIQASSTGYIGSLLAAGGGSVGITRVFATDTKPFIWVDKDNNGTRITLTQYDGSEKTGLGEDYSGRVENYSWTSGTKTLYFDVTKFSTYGFCVINEVKFTSDSTQGGYDGSGITIKVEVKDSNGELVEGAPVTLTKLSGDTIGSFVSNPVNTDSNGIASFTLNLNAVGVCTFDANVDSVHSVADQITWCIDSPAYSGRSLLRQYEQIRWSETYDDAIASVNTSSVAEPTVISGSPMRLEHDMNVIRTLTKQLKGGTNWFDDLGKYFDPTNTTSGGALTKQMSLENIKGHTTDSQTILLAVTDDNSGDGFTTASGDAGILMGITTRYATYANRQGLPIFSSAGNTYADEGGSDNVCVIDLINTDTGGEFVDGSGNTIFGKFHDAADHGGTGSLTDVYVKFYTSAGPYTFASGDPTNIVIIYPHRKVMDDLYEWEWSRTDFVSSFEGDEELIEDVANLWSFTGAVNEDTAPTWTNITGFYPLSGDPSDLEAAINTLNNEIGDMTFSEDNYIDDNDTVANALNDLDMALKVVADSVLAGVADKYVEGLSSDITAGVVHPVPGFTYTPDSTSDQEGSNMDILLNGQLLSASTGANGVNADRDYAETTASGITFHMDVHQYSNITYMVRQ